MHANRRKFVVDEVKPFAASCSNPMYVRQANALLSKLSRGRGRGYPWPVLLAPLVSPTLHVDSPVHLRPVPAEEGSVLTGCLETSAILRNGVFTGSTLACALAWREASWPASADSIEQRLREE